jgi:GcrA cell cycle regulator
MSWTDERVEILTKMWAEGNSASQIAKELGGVTRNAVIGKVHRLGLSNRATTTTSNKSESKTKSSPKSSSRAKQKSRKVDVAEPKSDNVTSLRRQIIPAGQPLPPQPSANEISPEALARVSEIEKKAKKIELARANRKNLQMASWRSCD